MRKSIQILTILVVALLFTNCDNDDGNAPNETACNYKGFSYLDTSDNTQILVPEADIGTQFFPNASNGPNGSPGFEIVSNATPNAFFFTTDAIVLNQTGTGRLTLNNGQEQVVTVTNQRAGTAVGEEVRLDVVLGSIEVEFCVVIDEVL